ncbi:MAG: tetratricopeptide repeat protein [Geodermatophilaceae bacterium]|nr:tetratricopeptide repeat protein [Geodermatophilaceae bacterium]
MFTGSVRARRLHVRALRLWGRERHHEARVQAARALRRLGHPRGIRLPAVADHVDVLFTLARFASELTDHDGAERRLAAAVDLLRGVRPGAERNLLLCEALVQLGETARLAGRHGDAESALLEASAIIEIADLDGTHRAAACNALGSLASATGRYAEAGIHYNEALAILQAEVGLGSPKLANVHQNLAGLAYSQGNHVEAETLARRALQLRQRRVPRSHTDRAGDLSVLGAALIGQGRYDEAEPLVREALRLWTDRFGPQHYGVAVNLGLLAAIQRSYGHLGAAEASLAKTLQIKQRILGEGHDEVAEVRRSLAHLDAQAFPRAARATARRSFV